MAFVIIQHLDPNYVGAMPELLQRVTTMKVLQATDKLKLKPDHVYIIPPNKTLSLVYDELHLANPLQLHGLRLPIDIFFRSLADSCSDKSIGIILSGMGSDGSLGIQAIKEKKGLVLVQDPADSKFDSMPQNAIKSINVDIVASAKDLPNKLLELLKISPILLSKIKPSKEINKGDLEKIIWIILKKTGHDFSMYKKTTLIRRIQRRIEVHQKKNLKTYVLFLMENPNEVEILFKELLIGVTSFFRDTKVWKELGNNVLPALIRGLPHGYTLRAWVTSCSTGEEAYSLAIIFQEALKKLKNDNITLQIFATDIDREAIEKARKGFFPTNIISDVSPELIKKYFISDGDIYRVNSSIRKMIVFAEQNVIRDPPFTKLDILTCRNLLIYMEQELQNKLLSLFYYSLNSGGIMILGTAESLGNQKDWFIEKDSKLKIFNRSTGISPNILIDTPTSFYHQKTMDKGKKSKPKIFENIQTLTDQFVIQKIAPASVLVNEKGDIIYITGHTGKFLEPVAGKANWNIHAMAREGIRHELPGAFRNSIEKNVVIRGLKVMTDGIIYYLDIRVERITSHDSLNNLIIVSFIDAQPPIVHEFPHSYNKTGTTSKQQELKEDLRRVYEDLRTTQEEMQTSQEELKSTNEELQSTNEELQSTNEELTTSKEEMQSLNEELQTVNSELQSKITDLILANNDMKNLLNSTEIATLFLDKKLNIRRYTDPVTKIFNIRISDVGRPFTDLVNNLQYKKLEEDTRRVLETLTTMETEASTQSGMWYNVRIMPYRTYDDHIDGLVITLTDITIAKKLELKLRKET